LLTTGAIAAVAREFQIQSHLLMASIELAMQRHLRDETVDRIMTEAWLGASWIASERLARRQHLTSDAAGLARWRTSWPLPQCCRPGSTGESPATVPALSAGSNQRWTTSSTPGAPAGPDRSHAVSPQGSKALLGASACTSTGSPCISTAVAP